MPTTRRPPLPALTGLRAVAAVWVVLFHYRDDLLALVPGLAPFDTFMRAGYLGVDLFFPLSGFVLAYTYADRMRSLLLAGDARLRAKPVRPRLAGARAHPQHRPRDRRGHRHARGGSGRAPSHRRGLRREPRDGAHVVQRPAELQLPGVVDQLGVVRLPARAAALRRSSRGCAGPAPPSCSPGCRMPRCCSSSRRWPSRTATSSTCSTCGSWASSSAGCCSASPGCAVGPALGRLVVVLPLTLLVLGLVPAASSGHYWAAPALGLGVAALAGSSGWITQALSWPVVVAAGEASYALYMTHALVQPFVHSLRVWAEGSAWASALVLAGVAVLLGRDGLARPRRGRATRASVAAGVAAS